MGETRVKVWDGWVRLWHWSIVLLIPVSYLTAQAQKWDWHFYSGYALLTLVSFRILWGVFGSEPARFATFLKSPFAALAHLARIRREEGPDRELTHNPAGGWVALAMMALLLAQAVSGLFAYDQIFTYGPLARQVSEETRDLATSLHIRVINVLLGLIALHILAIVWYRLIKGHDLVQAMMIGTKPMPEGTRAPRMAPPLLGLALFALCAAVVLYIRSFGDY
ncbi:cytochrome b/b6 domain-containing protein [Rubritepida flocculans]|jgi:cytochrome b|uniref:cytochrome b/b6 domain-containing protein n=1 Tax=Rubritepida flocculans TaxID=182403 RepID=UPI00041D7C38|nr:cytochrome b/b6 domain-containing protein [Rubritepida flocculans]